MTLPSLKDSIRLHGLEARKSLGQHFLLDPGLCARIAALGGDLASRAVIEVGPGPGGLTRALIQSPASHIYAVEIDERAWPLLDDLALHADGRLHVIRDDALRLNVETLGEAPRQIIANLPYNVATPLLVGWLRQAASWERMTLMFQLEVAERICAQPGSNAYGRLAVIAQWCTQCYVALKIPPGAFSPPPKVHSAVVVLTPHKQQPPLALFEAMESVTAAAFGQRRKMLRSSLKSIGGATLLQRAEIDPTRRAETLSIEEFVRLAELYHAKSL